MSKDNGGPAGDRELLEMAGKADDRGGVYSKRACALVSEDGFWMPHSDYGDALKLAESLGLLVGKSTTDQGLYFATRKDLESMYLDHSICRAITRAAAAIGSAM